MLRRVTKYAAATAAACGFMAAPALAAGPPPPPQAVNGHSTQLVASGLTTPTSFAFGANTVFEGDAGNPPQQPGGVYQLAGGQAKLIPGSPGFVSGLAWHNKTLYVSAGYLTAKGATFKLLAWSGWNGTTFAHQKTIFTAPKGFQGFNGIAFGPDGRLYVGVDLGLLTMNDHGAAKTPYVDDILSMAANGKQLKVFATGMRQPWQLAFAKGDSSPFVTDFGQDCGGKAGVCGNSSPPIKASDFLLHVRRGNNYGFPQCNHTKGSKCAGFAKPFKVLPAHTDAGGIVVVGKTLYLGTFGFDPSQPARVLTVPLKGGAAKTVVKSATPVMAIGVSNGYLYIGTGAGFVYRIKL